MLSHARLVVVSILQVEQPDGPPTAAELLARTRATYASARRSARSAGRSRYGPTGLPRRTLVLDGLSIVSEPALDPEYAILAEIGDGPLYFFRLERDLTPRLRTAALQLPAVTLTGPRQSGKSTLCRELFGSLPYVSLEAPDTRAFARDGPRGFLAGFPGGAVIDEVQRAPDLPSYLQGIIDDDPLPGREHAGGLTLVDSKASRTAAASLFDGARRVASLLGDEAGARRVDIVYGGGEPQTRSDARLLPWNALELESWAA